MEKISQKQPKQEEWENNVKNYLESRETGKTHYDTFCLVQSSGNTPEELSNPDKMGLLEARILLTDLNQEVSNQDKFIGIQQFQSFGDISTLDIVKLPGDRHRDIVREYFEKVIPSETESINQWAQDYSQGGFLIAGGSAKVKGDQISFHDYSKNYGNEIGVYNINDLASYLISQSKNPLKTNQEMAERGRSYSEKILDFMASNKLKGDFYERLADFYVFNESNPDYSIDKNTASAFVGMKAKDRAIKEKSNIISTLVDELSGPESITGYMLRNSAPGKKSGSKK